MEDFFWFPLTGSSFVIVKHKRTSRSQHSGVPSGPAWWWSDLPRRQNFRRPTQRNYPSSAWRWLDGQHSPRPHCHPHLLSRSAPSCLGNEHCLHCPKVLSKTQNKIYLWNAWESNICYAAIGPFHSLHLSHPCLPFFPRNSTEYNSTNVYQIWEYTRKSKETAKNQSFQSLTRNYSHARVLSCRARPDRLAGAAALERRSQSIAEVPVFRGEETPPRAFQRPLPDLKVLIFPFQHTRYQIQKRLLQFLSSLLTKIWLTHVNSHVSRTSSSSKYHVFCKASMSLPKTSEL